MNCCWRKRERREKNSRKVRKAQEKREKLFSEILNFTSNWSSAIGYIAEISRWGDKQFVCSLWNRLRWGTVFPPPPTISWPMIHHLLTISGYAPATLVIPWREFWAENTSGDDKPGIFRPKFARASKPRIHRFLITRSRYNPELVRRAICRWRKCNPCYEKKISFVFIKVSTFDAGRFWDQLSAL